jgi:nucleotide-binding universal stress UspA family protein
LKFRRILVATDGTEASLRGVAAAADIAQRYGAELLLMTAVPIPQHVVTAATIDGRGIERYVERMASEALRGSIDLLRDLGMGAAVKVVTGQPAESVVAEAAASRADLVVMGRRSRVEPKDLVLGSVSDRVARNLSVPILLIP